MRKDAEVMRERIRGAAVAASALALGLAFGATQLSVQAQSPLTGSNALIGPISGSTFSVSNTECEWPGGPLDDAAMAMLYSLGAPLRGYDAPVNRAAARILKDNWMAAGAPASFDIS